MKLGLQCGRIMNWPSNAGAALELLNSAVAL